MPPSTQVPQQANQPQINQSQKIQVEVEGGEVVVIQRYSRKFLLRREISISATMSKTVWRVHKQRHGLQVQSVDESITELFSIQVTPRQRHLNQREQTLDYHELPLSGWTHGRVRAEENMKVILSGR